MPRKKSTGLDQLVDAVAFFKNIREQRPEGVGNPIVQAALERIEAQLKDDLFEALNQKRKRSATPSPPPQV